jgi:hypothetical protein
VYAKTATNSVTSLGHAYANVTTEGEEGGLVEPFSWSLSAVVWALYLDDLARRSETWECKTLTGTDEQEREWCCSETLGLLAGKGSLQRGWDGRGVYTRQCDTVAKEHGPHSIEANKEVVF